MASIFTVPYVDVASINNVQYTAADALGVSFTMAVPQVGVIETMRITDLADQGAAFDIVLFDSSITSGTNNDAYDMADADRTKWVGHVAVTAADYSSFNDNSVAIVTNVGLAYIVPGGIMTVQCVVRGTPTYAAAGDLSISPIIWIP